MAEPNSREPGTYSSRVIGAGTTEYKVIIETVLGEFAGTLKVTGVQVLGSNVIESEKMSSSQRTEALGFIRAQLTAKSSRPVHELHRNKELTLFEAKQAVNMVEAQFKKLNEQAKKGERAPVL